MKNYNSKIKNKQIFQIATQEEMIKARSKLGWPTWEKEIEKLVNKEDYKNK